MVKKAQRNRLDVIQFAEDLLLDENVSDYIIQRDLCRTINANMTEANVPNIVEIYGSHNPDDSSVKEVRSLVMSIDNHFHHYFPFEELQFWNNRLVTRHCLDILNVPVAVVRLWNNRFSKTLGCPQPCPCSGDGVFWNRANEIVPIEYERECLSEGKLFNAFIHVVEKTFRDHKLSITELENADRRYYDADDREADPLFRYTSISTGAFVGSLAANYYSNEIAIGLNQSGSSGFEELTDWIPADADKRVDFTIPRFNETIDRARKAIANRIDDPRDKGNEWYNDVTGVRNELMRVLEPIKIGRSR